MWFVAVEVSRMSMRPVKSVSGIHRPWLLMRTRYLADAPCTSDNSGRDCVCWKSLSMSWTIGGGAAVAVIVPAAMIASIRFIVAPLFCR
jgi:hypothetical protein